MAERANARFFRACIDKILPPFTSPKKQEDLLLCDLCLIFAHHATLNFAVSVLGSSTKLQNEKEILSFIGNRRHRMLMFADVKAHVPKITEQKSQRSR
jgi:hypothetical protein